MFSGQPWVNVPLHSAVEVFGAFAGIMTGIIMLMRKGEGSVSYSVYISCGLIAMGILDIFHASVAPGSLFVWLHSIAVLLGGLFFAMTWLPEGDRQKRIRLILPSAIAAGAVLGMVSVISPESLPAMTAEGKMSTAAISINVVSGIFFLLSAPKFFHGYRSSKNKGDFLFFIVSLFFGLAGFVFYFDSPWQSKWWLWHFIRLTAFIVLFGYVVTVFRNVIASISNSVGIFSTISTEIAATITQHERTASQQASAVNETTTTIDELGASSRQTSEQAASASESAEKSAAMTEEGARAVKEAIEAMGSLNDKIGAVAEKILKLGEQTAQVGSIANLVKDIAGQTNMLALNAAVEAARAGEHGKGFAVVASEVRKLADQSRKSAEQANVLVAEIQKATNSTIMKTEEGANTAKDVTALAQKIGGLFNSLSAAASSVYENAQQVMLNARQQSAAISQVVTAMNSVNTGTRETAAGISQTKIGIDRLNEAALELKKMV